MYGDKKLLVVLDEDDLLNPGETVDRYKLGIDMNYLVKHFGQGNQVNVNDSDDESETSNSEYISDEDFID